MEEIQDLSQYQRRGRLKKGQRYARDVAEELGLKVYKYKGETIWKTYDGWRAGATYDDAVEGRRFTQRRESIGHKNSRLESLLKKEGERHRGLTHSSPEAAAESWAKKKAIIEYNQSRGLKPGDPEFLRIEHRIQLGNKDFWNSPQGLEIGRPDDGWNIIGTTQEQYNIKDALEKKLKGYPYVIDIDDYTGETTIVSFDDFDPYIKAGDQGEIVKAGSNLDAVAAEYKGRVLMHKEAKGFVELMDTAGLEQKYRGKVPLSIQNETLSEAKSIQDLANEAAVNRGIGKRTTPFWNEVEDALSKPFTLDPESEFTKLGIWHDGATLDDSWVKISRELNLESGKFDDATGVFHYSKDPTARTSIDILSDIGQGEGEYADIVKLKNKFHDLKRSLPPGEYYLHADNPTKAKYYQRAFKNDPWIGPSGEQGGGRLKSKVPGQKGEYVKYNTLKLTVPERADQFAQAAGGPYPRWQDQGIPQSDNKASDIARRTKAQMSLNSPLSRLNRGLQSYSGKLRKTTLAADVALTGNPVSAGALALQTKPVAKRVVKPVVETVAEKIAKLTAKRTAGTFAKTAIPIAGDLTFGGLATAGYLSQRRYKPAAVEVLSTIVGLVPGWGDAISATLDAGQLANDIDYLNRQIGL